MKYGLIGKDISYSFSKKIHNLFGNNEYEIKSIDSEEVKQLLTQKDFLGINVTIPYKQLVIDYLDVVDESVKNTGACNLIINKENKLYGYNSDFFGFLALVKKDGYRFKNAKVAVLGSGATCKTVCACLKKLEVREIDIISRGDKYYHYSNLPSLDVDYLINTTPVGGMFLDKLICEVPTSCIGVIDVNYRPNLSRLLLEAKAFNVKHSNGLYMLVYQAYLSHIKFFDLPFDEREVNRVYNELKKESTNIVLIGMPYSGKSSIGALLAKRMNRELVDVDTEVEIKGEMSIPEMFKTQGEAYFRYFERKVIESHKFDTNSVIVLGGGAIKDIDNLMNIYQNGIIYLIKRDIKNISFDDSRPLSNNKAQYISLLNEREKMYNKYAVKSFDNNSDLDSVVKEVEREFNENFNY